MSIAGQDQATPTINYLLVDKATAKVLQGGTCSPDNLSQQAWNPLTQSAVQWAGDVRNVPTYYIAPIPS